MRKMSFLTDTHCQLVAVSKAFLKELKIELQALTTNLDAHSTQLLRIAHKWWWNCKEWKVC